MVTLRVCSIVSLSGRILHTRCEAHLVGVVGEEYPFDPTTTCASVPDGVDPHRVPLSAEKDDEVLRPAVESDFKTPESL